LVRARGYATGVGFVAAGDGTLTGVQARLDAILVIAMLASFAPLVHEPMLLAHHSIHMKRQVPRHPGVTSAS
jgi:hypothetical protein